MLKLLDSGLFVRFKNDSGSLASVYGDSQRPVKPDDPQMGSLLGRLETVEKSLVEYTFAAERIDREIADAERRKIMEEVCALTRLDTIIA